MTEGKLRKRPVALIIMDGFGLSEKEEGNAIKKAYTPNLTSYMKKYPNSRIKASGLAVGLPEGQMGTSEVGHMNLGAGRTVYQELVKISKSISDGDFFEKQELLDAIENCKKNNSNLHLYGLLSDGGVHSHINHLYALLKLVKQKGFERVYIHCFLDGRDTSPTSGAKYISELEEKLKEIGIGKIATVMGRYYVMDRDKRWERVQLGYDAMVLGKGGTANNAKEAVLMAYEKGETDEFIKPIVIKENQKPISVISENDSIIFYNFRADRAREITRAIVEKDFDGFVREKGYFKTYYVCMTQYEKEIKNVKIVFKPEALKNKFGEYISSLGLTQLRIAETEKYAHVTFFFNGGIEEPSNGEDRILVPSPKVATYDLQPEMSAYIVADKAVSAIGSDKYDVIILNFANPDMVGHTGVLEAAIKAVEVTDECVGKVVEAILEKNGSILITADHGNADEMYDFNKNEPITSHTTNDTPLILIGEGDVKLENGTLANIAPTMLEIMGLSKPSEMTAKSLI